MFKKLFIACGPFFKLKAERSSPSRQRIYLAVLASIPALTACNHLKPSSGSQTASQEEVPIEAAANESSPSIPESEELVPPAPTSNSNTVPEASFTPTFAGDPPELLYRPVPIFHESADFDAIVGSSVTFRVVVNEAGFVKEARLLETTHPANVTAARDAVLQSRYRPIRAPQGFAIQVALEETLKF